MMTPSQKRLFEALKNNQGTCVIDENGFIHVTDKAMREAVANFYRFPEKAAGKHQEGE